MRLPASVLGSLRVGLSATAMLAAGCDQASLSPAEAPVAQAQPVATSAVVAEVFVPQAPEALGSEIEALVDAAAELPLAEVSPLVAVATAVEDPTDFVPFADDPRAVLPIQARPRVRAPKRQPRRVSGSGGTWETPRVAPTQHPEPKWSDGGCPACGRG